MKAEQNPMAGWRMAEHLLKPLPVLASMRFGPWRNPFSEWRKHGIADRHTANMAAACTNAEKPCVRKGSGHRPPPATSATYFQHGTR
jgi:hypothetical protein